MDPKLVVAGIDVHKKMLAVVVVDEDHPEQAREQRKFATNGGDLKHLAAWLDSHGVSLVVMESTALYWRPVWLALEGQYALHLAQAQSNAAPRGRKSDYADALRLARRFLAAELRLSFAGCRAADLAQFIAQQTSEETAPSTDPEPDRSSAGRVSDQAVKRHHRSIGVDWIPHSQGAGQRGNGSGQTGGTGGS
jgi:Transposase